MSQVTTQPRISAAPHDRAMRNMVIAGLVALVAAGAVALVLAVTKDSGSQSSSSPAAVSASRPDNGPSESSVAAAVGQRPVAGPSETRVAASLRDGRVQFSSGPDESRTASAIAGR